MKLTLDQAKQIITIAPPTSPYYKEAQKVIMKEERKIEQDSFRKGA